VLNPFVCHSTLSFLAAFLIACFFFSNSTTRFLVGAFLVAVGVLIVWCIKTAWTDGFNLMTLEQLPWVIGRWNTCKAFLHRVTTHGVGCQERQESSEAPSDSPNDDERQSEKRQRSWLIFVRKPTADWPIRVDNNDSEARQV